LAETVQQAMPSLNLVEKLYLQADQKSPGAKREKSPSGGVLAAVRWKEAIERNEADGFFQQPV
jgi:hypothetical protein